MSEFRTGNKAKSHPYPITPRSGGLFAFARNSAAGPEADTLIAISPGGTFINWNFIAAGPASGVNVPVVPRVTGIIRVIGVVTIKNTTGSLRQVTIEVFVGNVVLQVPFGELPTLEPNALAVFPILTEVNANTFGAPAAIGVTADIRVRLTADVSDSLQLIQESSTLDVQELPPPTG